MSKRVKWLAIFILGALTPPLIMAVLLIIGVFDFSAIVPPSNTEKTVAQFILKRSWSWRSPDEKAPAPSAQVLGDGLKHYKAHCLGCHGAPGIKPVEFAPSMYPPPPKLELELTQNRSDGVIFRILSHGIKMTGMPGFSPTHTEDEIWNLVAFLRRLPHLTESEKNQLGEEAP